MALSRLLVSLSPCLLVLVGCAGSRGNLHKALLADRNPPAHARDLDATYQIHYPDVLKVEVAGGSPYAGVKPVGLDGRICLHSQAYLPVDGETTPEVAVLVARALGVPPAGVRVTVTEFASQSLYLFGEVGDKHQVVPYRGPETIVDLLQRIGGTTEAATLSDVRVVRAHVADGKPPEVFHVDLHAILKQRDQQTNIRLEPFDRVHIGQSRTSRVAECLPPWLTWAWHGKAKK